LNPVRAMRMFRCGRFDGRNWAKHVRIADAGDLEVIRRHRHGASSRPPSARPGAGYGRPIQVVPEVDHRAVRLEAAAQRDPARLLHPESSDITQHA
jgi:hypothetical protein